MATEIAVKTISTVYENGVLRPLEQLDLDEHQAVQVQILPANVRVSALTAKRQVSRLVLDEISYLMGAEQPALVQIGRSRYVWRVPIVLTYPTRGVMGTVGQVDVDAETGDISLSETTLADIKRNAQELVAHFPSEAIPTG